MSNKHERIREIKSHIQQLLSELRRIEPNYPNFDHDLSFHSILTRISPEECLFDCPCPYLSRQQTIFHSTTYHEYPKPQQEHQKSPKKNLLAFALATSTPKTSPNENLPLKPYRTSTPRRPKQPSTNFIPLKRLLYNQHPPEKESHRCRPTKKRSPFPLPSMNNHLHWI